MSDRRDGEIIKKRELTFKPIPLKYMEPMWGFEPQTC